MIDSPYVASASRKSVSYTKTFREMAQREYCNVIDPVEIFANHGFDTEVLGKSRILGFIKLLREVKERGLNFTEGNEPYPTDAEKKYTFPAPPKLPKCGRPPVMSPVRMNLKKIRRLMKKYNLACPLRQVNPYKQQAKKCKKTD